MRTRVWAMGITLTIGAFSGSVPAWAAPPDPKVLCELVDVALENGDAKKRQDAWKAAAKSDPSLLGKISYQIDRQSNVSSGSSTYNLKVFLNLGGKKIELNTWGDVASLQYSTMLQALQRQWGNIDQPTVGSTEDLFRLQNTAATPANRGGDRPLGVVRGEVDQTIAAAYGAYWEHSLKPRQAECEAKGLLAKDRKRGETNEIARRTPDSDRSCVWTGTPKVFHKGDGSSCGSSAVFCAGMMKCTNTIGGRPFPAERIVTCEAKDLGGGKYGCGPEDECRANTGRGRVIFKTAEKGPAPGAAAAPADGTSRGAK